MYVKGLQQSKGRAFSFLNTGPQGGQRAANHLPMAQAWSSGRWNWALTSAIWIAAIVRASCDGGYDGESTSG